MHLSFEWECHADFTGRYLRVVKSKTYCDKEAKRYPNGHMTWIDSCDITPLHPAFLLPTTIRHVLYNTTNEQGS